MNIEQEIASLKERNSRVDIDKAWETSTFRKTLILIATYLLTSLTMYVIGVPNFYLSAMVPTIGFFLSTLTFPVVKGWWIRKFTTRSE